MKRGFTLVELLVVIGIIGVLAGVLIASLSGSTDSARAATCLSNMRNLAAACQSYGAETQRYPLAGSIEWMKIDESDGLAHAKARYYEAPGWISWASEGVYKNAPASSQANSSWMTSFSSNDKEKNVYCITNGALWKYLSGQHTTYICPSHGLSKTDRPNWSYVMNAYFGWEDDPGSGAQGEHFSHISYGHLKRADRVLLFAELQFKEFGGVTIPSGSDGNEDSDCVLQYDIGSLKSSDAKGANRASSGGEAIGANHINGKSLFAHVAFADGHVEKLRIPYTGSIKNPQVDGSELRKLTAWLCVGADVSFDGKHYQRMDN